MLRLVLVLLLFVHAGCTSGRQEYRARAQEPYGTGGDTVELPGATLRITVGPYSAHHRLFDVKVFIENRGGEPLLFTSEGARLSANDQVFVPVLWKGYLGSTKEDVHAPEDSLAFYADRGSRSAKTPFSQLKVPPRAAAGILCSFETNWSREWHPEAIEFVLGTLAVGDEELSLGQVLLVQPE